MTDQQHPITPPPELVQEWWTEFERTESDTDSLVFIATQAARWGSDQELKACYEWVVRDWTDIQSADMLLAVRRPKPPSLKEQALLAIDVAVADGRLSPDVSNVVRRALEQLDD